MKYDSFYTHRKIKEITGTFKKRHQKKLIGDDNMVIFEQQIIDKWKKYLVKLFYDQRPSECCCFENQIITGPKILN